MKTRLTALLLALSMMLGLVSCGGQPVGEETSPATSQTPVESNGVEADNHYPVTVETYDQNGEIVEQTFEACPERVVSISQANTELLIALGLTDKIVATAHRFSPVYERMADEYNSIPFIAESGYPSKEVVLDQKPDLIVGWGSLFAEDALGAVSDWHERGVHTYLMNNTVSGLGNRTVDFLYDDIEKLGQIFDIEDDIRDQDLGPKERMGIRNQRTKPLVNQIFEEVKKIELGSVTNGLLKKALTYLHNHEGSLNVFLNDPEVPADNNGAERGFVNLARGRHNWMFAFSECGARAIATMNSMVQTALANQLNVNQYLKYCMEKLIPYQEEEEFPETILAELLPWQKDVQKACKAIDISQAVLALEDA